MVCVAGKTNLKIENKLNTALAKIYNILTSNYLKINLDKTQIMTLGVPQRIQHADSNHTIKILDNDKILDSGHCENPRCTHQKKSQLDRNENCWSQSPPKK